MEKNYNPQEFEKRIYKDWSEKDCFSPKGEGKAFSIVMPPPNITGQLHMGHALDETLQDIATRYKRMSGFSTLWVPGTDHASIATEVKVVDKIKEETGKTKEEIGREEFLKRAYAWKEQYAGRICEQLESLGSSCDWSRLAFTMDERCSKAVREVFVKLYNKGLIYKGHRMINWCPSCKTALSDAEVEYEEQKSNLWHIRYPLSNGDGELVVATTRPETLFGDTAVAVNPKDKRYSRLVGKTLKLPLTDREIPIIADEYVEMDFGTGAVKITPAHDPNDYEVGLRHNLEVINILTEDGHLNEFAGKFCTLYKEDARPLVAKELEEKGYLVKVEPYTHNVGVCYRCHSTVEPAISDQWFVKMETLAKPAIDAVKNGDTKFIPKRFEKTYFHWLNNIKDWCISRQLWWGHRIPCWYCDDCGKMSVSMTDLVSCPHCESKNIHQDEDVLDTWFSSALWPFSTLGYPDKTDDLAKFYPTSLLITGYDIIFFWVVRMMFSGIEHMGEVPFRDVLIHGLVRDSQGRKMSKSLGNGIDPMEIISNYGADALRFSLVMGVANGADIRYSQDKLDGARNFMNKVWNASRYVLMSIDKANIRDIKSIKFSEPDKWILGKLNKTIKEVHKLLDKYEFGLALAFLYDFVWSDFCDWYIELSKPILKQGTIDEISATATVLYYVLSEILKLLHPFVPFITEEIWHEMGEKSILMLESFPKVDKTFNFETDFDFVKEFIEKIRTVRADMKVEKQVVFPVYIKLSNPSQKSLFENGFSYIQKLAGVEKLVFISSKEEIAEKVSQGATSGVEFYIPLGSLLDFDKEIARLNKEIEKVKEDISRHENLLGNAGFIAKAPASLVESEKAKLSASKDLLSKLSNQINNLSN